jgi:hypothetical protein
MPVVVIPSSVMAKANARSCGDRALRNFSLGSRASASEPRRPRQVAGEGCNCRYIKYALIEPVLENSCQKNSEVRISAAVPLLCSAARAAHFRARRAEYSTALIARQVLTIQGFSAP